MIISSRSARTTAGADEAPIDVRTQGVRHDLTAAFALDIDRQGLAATLAARDVLEMTNRCLARARKTLALQLCEGIEIIAEFHFGDYIHQTVLRQPPNSEFTRGAGTGLLKI